MMDKLDEIRQRAEAATPGPWKAKTNGHPQCDGEPWGWITGAPGNIVWSGAKGQINADFIAHSREDIPYLLSDVDRLEKGWQEALALANTNAKLFDEATARAEAAEVERDRAIEDMKFLSGDVISEKKCYVCRHYIDGEGCTLDSDNGECRFEWRGKQAGKGDSNAND